MIRLPYIEPVFRPPSEARSLVRQVTRRCSWNRCTFCEMNTQPQRRFSLRSQGRIDGELEAIARTGAPGRQAGTADLPPQPARE